MLCTMFVMLYKFAVILPSIYALMHIVFKLHTELNYQFKTFKSDGVKRENMMVNILGLVGG